MVTQIYYFTGTGNTLWIAKLLKNHLGDVELIPFEKIYQLESLKIKAKKVGFLFPVHYYGLPQIVECTIPKMDLSACEYIFGIANCGSLPKSQFNGPAFYLTDLLKQQNKKLNFFDMIWMPGNYVIDFPNMPKWIVSLQLQLGKRKIKNFSQIIVENKDYQKWKVTHLNQKKHKAHINWRNNLSLSATNFTVDDNCTNCGICQNVCPVQNIDLIHGSPQWHQHCQEYLEL